MPEPTIDNDEPDVQERILAELQVANAMTVETNALIALDVTTKLDKMDGITQHRYRDWLDRIVMTGLASAAERARAAAEPETEASA